MLVCLSGHRGGCGCRLGEPFWPGEFEPAIFATKFGGYVQVTFDVGFNNGQFLFRSVSRFSGAKVDCFVPVLRIFGILQLLFFCCCSLAELFVLLRHREFQVLVCCFLYVCMYVVASSEDKIPMRPPPPWNRFNAVPQPKERLDSATRALFGLTEDETATPITVNWQLTASSPSDTLFSGGSNAVLNDVSSSSSRLSSSSEDAASSRKRSRQYIGGGLASSASGSKRRRMQPPRALHVDIRNEIPSQIVGNPGAPMISGGRRVSPAKVVVEECKSSSQCVFFLFFYVGFFF